MRIDSVVAEPFGPFPSGEHLEFAPGMTVVHGLNEAGKSSWFAAIRGGLCGVRRARGRARPDDREFKQRHKPWHGRGWKVGVKITLDDGRRLELTQDLERGSSQLRDLSSGETLSTRHLENEGGTDGSLLLGLDRRSVLSTIFVAQAEILRVLDDADALQEFLQRAATSHTVDTTVEEALEWLASHRKARVGKAHQPKHPLAKAIHAQEEATRALDESRDAYDKLQDVLSNRKRAAERLAQADARIAKVSSVIEWRRIDELRERVRSARSLEKQLSVAKNEPPVDEDLVRRVIEALGAYQERQDPPRPPSGDSATDLRDQLQALPEAPRGDTEAHTTVTAAYEALLESSTELAKLDESRPKRPEMPALEVDSEHLRALAERIERPRPTVDAHLVARLAELEQARKAAEASYQSELQEYEESVRAFETARSEYDEALARYESQSLATTAGDETQPQPAPGRSRGTMLIAGAFVALAGVGVLVLSDRVIGAVMVGAGLAIAVIGLRGRPRAGPLRAAVEPGGQVPRAPAPPAPPTVDPPGPAPVPPTPDAELERTRAALELQEEQLRTHDQEVAQASDELAHLSLPEDPARLRELASQIDSSAERRASLEAWQERRDRAARALASALDQFVSVLRRREESLFSSREDPRPTTVEEARGLFRSYQSNCRERARQAQESSRRPDLERALASREEADQRYEEALREHSEAVERISELARETGVDIADREPAVALREWLGEQESRRRSESERREAAARLDQLLDGSTVEDLQQRLDRAVEAAGERPQTPTEDPERELERWKQDRDAAVEAVSQLEGQAEQLESALPSIAEAIEREAEAKRWLREVQDLERIFDLTERALRAAKELVNANIAPALTQRMRPWIPKVTRGRYSDLQVDADTLEVRLLEDQGTFRPAQVMSRGTMEQVYLLLRLALADLLATTDETLPVILDDVMVQSDPQRTIAFLDLLHDISQQRQVVLFTQEQEVLDWAEGSLVDDLDRRIELEPPTRGAR